MRKNRFALSSTVLLLLPASCVGTTRPAPVVDLAGEKAKLHEKEVAWSNEMAAKDVEKLVAHYAADGVLIAPEMPSSKGKDAIRRSLKETFADPNARLEFTTEKRRSRRPVTWLTHAVHTPRPIRIQTMKPVNDKGSFVTVYKKIGADWLAVADINTSEVH